MLENREMNHSRNTRPSTLNRRSPLTPAFGDGSVLLVGGMVERTTAEAEVCCCGAKRGLPVQTEDEVNGGLN